MPSHEPGKSYENTIAFFTYTDPRLLLTYFIYLPIRLCPNLSGSNN
jgi:hypothetical protein